MPIYVLLIISLRTKAPPRALNLPLDQRNSKSMIPSCTRTKILSQWNFILSIRVVFLASKYWVPKGLGGVVLIIYYGKFQRKVERV